jgi:hypothetical protein
MGAVSAITDSFIHQKVPTHQLLQLLQKYLKQLQLAWMDMIQEKQKLKEDQ